MDGIDHLETALRALGDVLAERGLAYDLVVIGGGALLLAELLDRPTEDLDVVARVEDGSWENPKPFPAPLAEAIRKVGAALGLSLEDEVGKDWLNPAPAFLLQLGLPEGFEGRVSVRSFGPLTLRIPARSDLITLKFWAATDAGRGPRRRLDIADLQRLRPTRKELHQAVRLCEQKDGRPDFFDRDARPVLAKLGVDLERDDG